MIVNHDNPHQVSYYQIIRIFSIFDSKSFQPSPDGHGGGLEKMFLDAISCRKIQCESQLQSFVSCTLFSIQNSPQDISDWTATAIKFIKENNFVLSLPEIGPGQLPLVASALGMATVASGNLLLIYICNFHVLSHLLLIYICKLHWNLNTMFVCQVIYF